MSECPGAVDLADLDDLGNVDAGLVRAGEVQRLVEDVRGRLRGVEDLGDGVTAVVDDLVVTGPDDLLFCRYGAVLGNKNKSRYIYCC